MFVHFADKMLNTEIFEYSKMLIDTELLSIINQLSKFLLSYNFYYQTRPLINNMGTLTLNDVSELLQ